MDMNAQMPARPWLAQSQADDDETDLQQLWRTLWRRKWSILSLVVVAVTLAIFAVLGITPVYRAGATLLIEEKQANVVSIEQVYGVEGTGSSYLQTQFELLKSRALAERVVRELNLTTHPEFDPRQQPEPLLDIRGLLAGVLDKIAPRPQPEDQEESPESAEARIFNEVTRAFMERISIELIGKSQLVKVQVDMTDAQLAANAANALARGFIESQMEAIMSMSATAATWMNSRLGELKIKLKEAEDRLQAFREQENLVDVGGVVTISAAELSATSDRMIDARRQRAEAESLYRQVQASRSAGWEHLASIPAVLGDPLIQQFKANEAQARAKVEELAKRYGPRHPAMEAAQTELAAASASLRGQVEQVVAGIQRNYQMATANEGSLRASVETNKAQIQNISRKEFKLRELQREVEANRTLYETFMTRLKETTATADLETANARVVDKASVPILPIKPKKFLIVALAGLLALFAGIGITLLLDALNNTFKSTEDVENKLYMPVLGILPLVDSKHRNRLAQLFGGNEEKAFSESIRTIRTGVILSGMNRPHQVLVITSSLPNEGKSTVASNLAFALGQMERILLIDADLRRPTLAKNFAFPVGTPGLANLIASTARLDECIRHVNGIDMIGAGAVPPNPLELLSSPRFAKIVEVLKTRYERIVIDSPPTQAVSDAAILATQANALIYVIKSEATPIPLAQKGIGLLLQSNTPITGVVLNQVDVQKAHQHGYSYGGYYDYYGYSKNQQA
ncbi:polysaccharide biosynthesis tyrosine autokinase [Azotobacter chroococcum]|uniref:GumC family protein n=1 Tax=Azotobacter chroococcum TaxID=353 RepID=UPI00103BADAD|nr:polysaccharide biosynthesis tyrosine autokinase [Azotobacter chroococcum]TBW08931.1 polysaccharide biosynthesis tyrosine autokinase [Azotobacter chroococcum]